MDFAHPKILYALLIIPILIGLYALARYSRRRKLARFGNPTVFSAMMPMASPYKPIIKFIFEILALACLIVALARPRYGDRELEENRRGIEVMIAFDVSNSMLANATDSPNSVSRLQRAKYLLGRLINQLDNDKVGLIVFAGTASTQLPLTVDHLTAKAYIDDLKPSMINTQGTNIGQAISMALECFPTDNDVNKAIVLITDCEDHYDEAIEMAKRAREAGVQVDVIGVGTEKDTPIPISKTGGQTQYLKDGNGQVVMTAFNPSVAQAIAEAGGGIYVDGSSNDAVDKIDECLDNITKADLGPIKYTAGAERFPIFLWIAFALVVIDIFILDRKIGWLQKINFFTKK